MTIKTKLTAVLATAATLATTQAETYASNSSCAGGDCAPIVSGNASIGYFTNMGEAYLTGAFGAKIGCDAFLGVQVTAFQDDQSVNLYGAQTALDVDFIGFGPVIRGYTAVDDKRGFYYSASAGAAYQDVSATISGTNITARENDTALYVDGAVGFQQFFNEALAFNIGLRLLYIQNAEFEEQGYALRTDFDNLNLGVEAGFIFQF